MILSLSYIICLALAIGMILSTRVHAPALLVLTLLTTAWSTINLLMLLRAWRALGDRGWATELREHCLLFGIPVDLWVIRHRDELMMTPLYSHARLEYDNYRELLRHRGRRGPYVWHFLPFVLLALTFLIAVFSMAP